MNTIHQLIEKQRRFFYTEQTKDIKWRKDQLIRLKSALIRHEKEIEKALFEDFKKPASEVLLSETGVLLLEINHAIAHLNSWCADEYVNSSFLLFPSESRIMHEPYGVCLIVSPWNYPINLSFAPLIGAIAAGNTAIIKPSELTPKSSAIVRKIVEETFQSDFIAVVEGGIPETQALLQGKLDFIFFTGSPQVGKIVMKAAAEQLIPVCLELGGKSPCIVDASAKISIAAKRIVQGKFFNCGQTCIAPDYVLVEESIKDEFVEQLKHYIHQFYGANPAQSADYGRIVNKQHLNRLLGYLADGEIAHGGEVDDADNYFSPTLLLSVRPDSAVMNEEIFGPVLPILTWKNKEEIIEIVRSKPKPLAYYHFTRNKKLREELLQRLSFGGGTINDTLEHIVGSELPFGGVGVSGIGEYHGKYSFTCFSHKKSILLKTDRIDLPLKYPPLKSKLNLLKKLFKWL
jgi:aldehyde dehydrogenase (NAD+)